MSQLTKLENELDMENIFSHEEETATTRKKALKLNLFWICVIWVFTFTAFSGLQNLEASLVPQFGVYSLAAITGGGLVSCIVAPAVITAIGAKGALIVSWICLGIFVAANYYPKAYILIPGAAIEGLSTGLMWTAEGAFLATISLEYSQIIGDSMDNVISKFFGIFCMGFQSTQIWGNVISSGVLHEGASRTGSGNNTKDPHSFCGANYCPMHQRTGNVSERAPSLPAQWRQDVLISIYLGVTIIGLVITIFLLKPLKAAPPSGVSIGHQLLATLRLLVTNLNMALLVPFSMYTGMEQVIMYAEFTKAYVTCTLGISYIGFTMICFGVVNTVVSPLIGMVGKYLGRLILCYIAMALNLGILAVLLYWPLDPGEIYVFFFIPGVWGLADAIWQTQSGALIGSIFYDQQEPAYANLRMWQALGFTITYLYSNSMCEFVKLYITAGVLVLSIVLLTVVELRVKKGKLVIARVI
ncbi:hypothetical protein CHS0354_025420 [Potamilus streckersoni]|uniref:Protein unc-93 homolog A n=1 Tax=Potamilus streckersoni TaxID=2493646 RepID=A0AAE0VYW6_9BIVA|nr:hypothetical protein CHS0354_025420 [Potamilus streckersoni]